MDSEQKSQIVGFDRFVVDTGRRQLLRDGAVVALNSKAFDLLVALVERRGELITKDSLLARVWPNQTVEEGNLSVHVSTLRKALGERRGEHRFIVTVPGRGYMFVADAPTDAAPQPDAPITLTPATPAPRRSRDRRVAVLAAAAVLAFAAIVSWRLTRSDGAIAADSTSATSAMTARFLTTVGNVSSAVLSPDGKRFAYALYQDGDESLWLGHVDGAQPTQIRPPEDVDYLLFIFSPNGDRLFYTARGALYQAPLPAGPPRKLLDGVSDGFSVSADGGRVAFVRRRRTEKTTAIVVAELDGTAREREVATLPAERGFSSYGPAWSPDGAALAVGVASPTARGRFGLTSVNVADGSMTPLGGQDWDQIARVAWLRDGSGIVFNAVSANSDFHLWFLDMASRRLRCITPDLSRYGRASVSASDAGTSLLSVRGVINSTVWVAPSGLANQAKAVTSRAFGKLDGSAGLTWAPDGSIVYVSFVNNSYAVWRMGADGGNPRQLTSPGFVDRLPQVTADGRVVVFESNRGGGRDIWRVDADGSHIRTLTTGGHNSQPALTPDGRSVLYASTIDGAESIWKMPVDGGDAVRVTSGPSAWPSVSPDGKLLAFASSDNPTGAERLAVVSFETGRTIADFAPARGARFDVLRWSADASAVMYRDFSQGLWRQPIAGGPAEKMAGMPDKRIYTFGWSRDWRQIAMAYGDEVRDVVLIDGFR